MHFGAERSGNGRDHFDHFSDATCAGWESAIFGLGREHLLAPADRVAVKRRGTEAGKEQLGSGDNAPFGWGAGLTSTVSH